MRFKENIWPADLAETGSVSSKDWGVKYLSCVIDVCTKYVWVKPLKDKRSKTILHGFIEIINISKRKPNKIWVDQREGFYNSPMQKFIDDNDILMYSTHNEGKPVVAWRFIGTLKTEICKKWQLVIVSLWLF